jgi:hypothetical protein
MSFEPAGGAHGGRVDEVHRELLQRAQEAIAEARSEHRRATDLVAFVGALRMTDPGGLVRCAWCGRVAAGSEWIDASMLLGGSLRERLRRNATHGICPACFERVSADAERERSAHR